MFCPDLGERGARELARADSSCTGPLGENGAVTSLATTTQSAALFARARDVTPGGVNSPVRAFRAVGGTPRFMARGFGPYLYDVDGTEYVDLVCSWGPLILGHAHPDVVEAVTAAVARGTSFGTPSAAGGRAGRGDRGAHPGRPGPARVVRHRGHHVGHPAGSRIHRPRPRGEVRRLLPRPRRLAARCRRLGAGDLRHPRHAWRAGGLDRADPGSPVQRPRRGRASIRRARGPDRLRDHRGRCRQHGRGRARRRLQRRARPALPRSRRPVRQRRGDDRLPCQPVRLLGHRRRGRGLDARPDDVRQGDGRRLPGRCVRWSRGRDGRALAGRPGLPGRHAVREPDRHHGRV